MADGTYTPLVYRKQGGSEFVIASGGCVRVESGGFIAAGSATAAATAIPQTTTTAVAISATGVSIINAILTALAGVGILAAT